MTNPSKKSINELRRNARSMVRELGLLNDAYFEIGITLAERHLLIELFEFPSPTMGEVADRLLLDKSTISRLISKAVKKGYIECITDKADKRRRFLQMTQFGKETLHAIEPIAFHQTEQALLTLTHEESQMVYQGVALYAKGLNNSRTQNKLIDQLTSSSNNNHIESLSEISTRIHQMGYVLRQYVTQDEQGLYEIFREVVDSGSQFPYECNSKEEFHRQFFNPGSQVYVCCSEDGGIVGGFYLKANFSGRSSHIANAAYMIQSSQRGKGIGSLLIKASLHLAKDLGFQAMQFNMVLSQNTLAVKLYQKMGFNIVGHIPEAVGNLDGGYQDGYVMYRKLF